MLDLIYPPGLYCISCGKITDSSRTYRLCNDCMQAMNWNTGRACSRCGRPLSENDPGEMCFSCAHKESSEQTSWFDRGYACTSYGAAEQSVIFTLKYGGRSDIGETLGEIMYEYMQALYPQRQLCGMYDMVVPVPVHKERKSRRGFNHAEVMAQSFAKRAGIRCESNALIRTRPTQPMKGLRPSERKANIAGVFEIRPYKLKDLTGARVLLIDDIFTTGATIDEAARILKCPQPAGDPFTGTREGYEVSSGASRVDFIAFAAAGDMINA
ncbi:MAG: ComF family protein [Mogibacterium sp.]|nr:ComF family protein [Mogibacterium sp.]